MKFSELAIDPIFDVALAKEQIVEPTPIQIATIPEVLKNKNIYISSETGTGKTLAFLLPLCQKIDTTITALQILVAVPTHELAMQIQQQILTLNNNGNLNIRSQVLIGSTAIKRQIEKLKKKPHIVIGSVGRINELIKMRKLKVHTVKTIVIDEADRMLYGDSIAGVKQVIKSTLRDRQLIFVSATEQKECNNEIAKICPDIHNIYIGANKINSNLEHLYLYCEERKKVELLRKLINAENPKKTIVFIHRNASAEMIVAKLTFHKFNVVDIHAAYDKIQRKNALQQFRNGKANILIASDIVARGLDIKDVTHIINYDTPAQSKAYLHRVGRTARAGKTGKAISFLTQQELRLIKRFERELNITIKPIHIKEGKIQPSLHPTTIDNHEN